MKHCPAQVDMRAGLTSSIPSKAGWFDGRTGMHLIAWNDASIPSDAFGAQNLDPAIPSESNLATGSGDNPRRD
jgi:hypothetical protein